uniref:Uncharacterized protein n=1 Tax=Rhizophora mucronata TaxID=61149 RepID=A0A2P2PHG2_RHIMU
MVPPFHSFFSKGSKQNELLAFDYLKVSEY